jgi:hypothetical protein
MNYEKIGADIGKLVETKQNAYGDSFGKSGDVMRILYPNGISAAQVDDALTVVRVLDKLFRIATDRDALGESPWRDVAGYALLSVKRVDYKSGFIKGARVCVLCGKDDRLNSAGMCFSCFSEPSRTPAATPWSGDEQTREPVS